MLKVKNDKGKWVDFPGYKPTPEELKRKLGKNVKIQIAEIPPMSEDQVTKFVEKWNKASQETIIQLIDDTE